MFKITNIKKSFGENEILKGIDLTVNDGDVIAILGPSGSGKTTFLRSISLLNKADSGQIEFDDDIFDLEKLSRKQTLAFRKKIGFVFQNYNLFINKTALQNVTEGLIIVHKMKKAEAEKIGREALDKVGLLDKADFYPSQLSGGQQQRVAIARALASNPGIIFFDEPTSALDPELTSEVLQVIKALADDGITMIIVTHEMQFARDVADRIVFMENGVVIEENTAYNFFNNPTNERICNFINMTYDFAPFVADGTGI